ncbi:MAG: hypothetical protein JXQ76_05275 [Campylobacterales bacterium]|nr:hypothetical protein [Campylobacterales bacterium]
MVKVAFLVEGKVEKILIDYLANKGWFEKLNIIQVGPTIDAKGSGNICPKNIPMFIEQIMTHNPDKIIILTDLECDPCVAETKKRLGDCENCIVILAKKAVEAWFLADDNVVSQLTRGKIRHYDNPERTTDMPFEELKQLALKHTDSGVGTKVSLCKKVLKKYNFQIENAANHPNCDSARYFLTKLTQLSK